MKNDGIEFDTQKSINQIANALRSIPCEMTKLDDDPLAMGKGPDIAIAMSNRISFKEIFKFAGAGKQAEWAVQVVVEDLGNRRHVILNALGEGTLAAMSGAPYYNLKLSKYYRDNIASLLA